MIDRAGSPVSSFTDNAARSLLYQHKACFSSNIYLFTYKYSSRYAFISWLFFFLNNFLAVSYCLMSPQLKTNLKFALESNFRGDFFRVLRASHTASPLMCQWLNARIWSGTPWSIYMRMHVCIQQFKQMEVDSWETENPTDHDRKVN
jgi:hypothetical protein